MLKRGIFILEGEWWESVRFGVVTLPEIIICTDISIMTIKILFISMWLPLIAVDSATNNKHQHRVTVVGTALVIKNYAAVRTDDSVLYYLDGIYEWEKSYLGKRVKVTGKLSLKEYREQQNIDPSITAIPQRDYGTQKIIKKPRWRLVE